MALNDEKLLKVADSYLPYSTGLEFECRSKVFGGEWNNSEYYQILDNAQVPYKAIPDIMDVNFDSTEQRFRIPEGHKGMIALYRICQNLKQHSFINKESGIHYHIDITKYRHLFFDCPYDYEGKSSVVRTHKDWVLKALDSWGYKGTYNSREFRTSKGGWIGMRTSTNTLEIRIGEMSFDYPVLINRIIHAQRIVKKLVSLLSLKSPLVKDESANKIITTERVARRDRMSSYAIFS